MKHRQIYPLCLSTLLLCTCCARQEAVASGVAPVDTSSTSVLPPEVYGRYYKLEKVVRQDKLLWPADRRSARVEDVVLGGDGGDYYSPRLMMFTPGFSHIDYVVPSHERVHPAMGDGPSPISDAYYAKKEDVLLLISDTTYIHPEDSLITTSLHTWNEGLAWHERRSRFRLAYADSSRLVIRAEYVQLDSSPQRVEEMHYRHIPQDSLVAGRTVRFFPSFEAADDFLLPPEGLSVQELGERRYPPFILRPDTLRIDSKGGTFPVESSLVYTGLDARMYGLSSYEGTAEADTIAWRYFMYPKDRSWVRCDNRDKKLFHVVVQPNKDLRPRRMEIVIEGDTFGKYRYYAIGRPLPSATLVIIQDGAQEAE